MITNDDIKALEARIARLEDRVAKVEEPSTPGVNTACQACRFNSDGVACINPSNPEITKWECDGWAPK